MRRNTNFVNNICHIGFQISLRFPFSLFCDIRSADLPNSSVSSSPDMFNPVQKHGVIKRLQHVIVCSQTECILRDPFLSNCGYYDKHRNFTAAGVMGEFLHHRQPVHFRHDNIQYHHVRFLIFYNVTDFFSVVCFSDQFKVFIFFDHLTQHICHFCVIVCNCYI